MRVIYQILKYRTGTRVNRYINMRKLYLHLNDKETDRTIIPLTFNDKRGEIWQKMHSCFDTTIKKDPNLPNLICKLAEIFHNDSTEET